MLRVVLLPARRIGVNCGKRSGNGRNIPFEAALALKNGGTDVHCKATGSSATSDRACAVTIALASL
jgi:hypothetical protein